MKKTKTTKLAIGLLIGGFFATLCGQGTPAKAKTGFKTQYPEAKAVKWEQENDSTWEVEFKLKGVECSANYANDGTWKETERAINAKNLPKNIQDILKKDFAGYEVEEAESVERPNFIGYELEIEKGKQTMEIVLDNSGKVIKQSLKTEESEED
jgi:hypothetical protein